MRTVTVTALTAGAMTAEVERAAVVDVDVETVWELLADPEQRAAAISVVASHEIIGSNEAGDEIRWNVELPIPMLDETIAVRTRETEKRPPEYVEYVGESAVFSMTGEHELREHEKGAWVWSKFTVDSSIPGVESYFQSTIDDEIDNLIDFVVEHTGAQVWEE